MILIIKPILMAFLKSDSVKRLTLESGEVPTDIKGTGLRLNSDIRLNDRQPYVENLDDLPIAANYYKYKRLQWETVLYNSKN